MTPQVPLGSILEILEDGVKNKLFPVHEKRAVLQGSDYTQRKERQDGLEKNWKTPGKFQQKLERQERCHLMRAEMSWEAGVKV